MIYSISAYQYLIMGRMDGSDARRRNRIRLRPTTEYVLTVQRQREGPQQQDYAGLL